MAKDTHHAPWYRPGNVNLKGKKRPSDQKKNVPGSLETLDSLGYARLSLNPF